jgi:SAM-dependent methyltransferase
MKQNKYDDPEFFANYSQIPRSVQGLDNAMEWPIFRDLLPDLRGKRVLDIGCGFGWHARYARQQQAQSVIGVDLSENMLARAAAMTDDPGIEYRLSAIEDIDFPADTFDVVLSSLALHYVEQFNLVCRKVYHCLTSGGSFVLSVEHPIFTARAAQQWHLGEAGETLHWPVDSYQEEGPRSTQWLSENVVKYHRSLATYVNTLLDSGFLLTHLAEPGPSPEMLIAHPDWSDERRRPMFLLIAAVKHPEPAQI